MSNSKNQTSSEAQPIFPAEFVAQFDSIKFDISDLKSKGLYDEDHIKDIDYDVDKISTFLHSTDCNGIQSIILHSFPRLAQNLYRHRFLDLLEPYGEMFKDHVIKIRSFPMNLLSMDDSETINGFYLQLQSSLFSLRDQKYYLNGFNVFHTLNFSTTKFYGITTELMKKTIDDSYQRILKQVNENLINLQSLLNLAYKIENDSSSLIDMDTMIIRKLPEIEQKLGLKVVDAYNIK